MNVGAQCFAPHNVWTQNIVFKCNKKIINKKNRIKYEEIVSYPLPPYGSNVPDGAGSAAGN
jgi:hypothetical protein